METESPETITTDEVKTIAPPKPKKKMTEKQLEALKAGREKRTNNLKLKKVVKEEVKDEEFEEVPLEDKPKPVRRKKTPQPLKVKKRIELDSEGEWSDDDISIRKKKKQPKVKRIETPPQQQAPQQLAKPKPEPVQNEFSIDSSPIMLW